MRVFYGGNMYDIQSIQFDLVGQTYCAWLKQYRVLSFWRRESNNIGIEVRDIWLYINTTTPHIHKMLFEKKNPSEICSEIGVNIINYIDYAANNKNVKWVNSVTGNPNMFVDRIEKKDVKSRLGILDDSDKYLEINNAY